MNREYLIRRIAGAFILLSLALAHWVSPYWLWFTVFVGLNLFQSSFTRICPLEWVLERAGIGGRPASGAGPSSLLSPRPPAPQPVPP